MDGIERREASVVVWLLICAVWQGGTIYARYGSIYALARTEEAVVVTIEGYGVAWHPQRGGRVRVKRSDRKKWGKWMPVTHEGLAGFRALMKEKPVFVEPNGWLRSGPEPVGEDEK